VIYFKKQSTGKSHLLSCLSTLTFKSECQYRTNHKK